MTPAVGKLAPADGMDGFGDVGEVGAPLVALAGAVPVKTVKVPPVRLVDGPDALAAAGALPPITADKPGGSALAVVSVAAADDDASGAGVPGMTTVAGVGVGASSCLLQPDTAIAALAMATAVATMEIRCMKVCMSVLEAASVDGMASRMPVVHVGATTGTGLAVVSCRARSG